MAELNNENRPTGRVRSLWNRWRWPVVFILLFLLFCQVAWLTFLTPNETDIAHYQCYGLTFWLGSGGTHLLPQSRCSFLSDTASQPALSMLPEEYPPLTIVLFSLPLLAPLPYYALAFALLMTLVAGLIYWLLVNSGVRRAAPLFFLYLLLGAAGVFQERFDLVPALCTLICLLAAERGYWRSAYVALVLGVLFKLYPIVMLPALFLAEQHAWNGKQTWKSITKWRWKNLALCVGLLILGMGGFALINFQNSILSPLTYFLQRPPQIESLIGSITWLAGHLGVSYTIDFKFGALIITSGLTGLISSFNTVLTLAGILAIFWLQWRERIDLAQALTALVCVLIVTGKVFSPQYLIWFIPFLAYISARGQTNRLWMVAWAVISLLTTFIYAVYYSFLPNPQTPRDIALSIMMVQTLPGFFEVVALRNLLLAVTVLAFLCGWWGTRRERVGV